MRHQALRDKFYLTTIRAQLGGFVRIYLGVHIIGITGPAFVEPAHCRRRLVVLGKGDDKVALLLKFFKGDVLRQRGRIELLLNPVFLGIAFGEFFLHAQPLGKLGENLVIGLRFIQGLNGFLLINNEPVANATVIDELSKAVGICPFGYVIAFKIGAYRQDDIGKTCFRIPKNTLVDDEFKLGALVELYPLIRSLPRCQ